MNQGLALRLLIEIMDWDDATAREEVAWLRLMADFKYDSYREYLAGSRFIESLAAWLQQFVSQAERRAAYDYVRKQLVFISAPEMQHLVERFYAEVIEPQLLGEIAARLGVEPWLVWAHRDVEAELESALRRSLFFGLSDGARTDAFRRANEGRIYNEQVAVAADIHPDKWDDIHAALQKCEGKGAKFDRIFLIDDFVGSGTTLLRWDEERKKWAGRMQRFWTSHRETFPNHLSPEWKLYVHHYIATQSGKDAVEKTIMRASAELLPEWFGLVLPSYGTVLPANLPLDKERDIEMWQLTEDYYDPSIETDSTRKGGGNVKRGFGNGGLPLVLEHNTPNNSVALLWADTAGKDDAHPMRPLFRRAQRHW